MGCSSSKSDTVAADAQKRELARRLKKHTPSVVSEEECVAEIKEKLQLLFTEADVGGGGMAAMADSNLTPYEMKHHFDRKQMKVLLDDVGCWEEFDSNRDGKLSLEELLDTMDTDNSGTISLEEYLTAVMKAHQPEAPPENDDLAEQMTALLAETALVEAADAADPSPPPGAEVAADADADVDAAGLVEGELAAMRSTPKGEDGVEAELTAAAAAAAAAAVDAELAQMEMELQQARLEPQPNPTNRADLVAKLTALFVTANVDAEGGGVAIAALSHNELQFHLDRKSMKVLLEDTGSWDKFDSNGDGKLSLDELLFHMDTDEDGEVSLLELLRTVFGMERSDIVGALANTTASSEEISKFSEHWV
jgi:Ca2+-binding EF-hand superfamily protein